MIRKSVVAISVGVLFAAATARGVISTPVAADEAVEAGRFVWHDLMTRDVGAAKRFYGELLGWRFEDTRRADRPYVLARAAGAPVGGIVDISASPNAGSQWLSFMSVNDVDKAVAMVTGDGGTVLVQPREFPAARAAVVADDQGAPLGLAQPRRSVPDPTQPVRGHFFWHEYLARDVDGALDFYKRLAGYDTTVLETRLGVEYHVLRKTRGRAGLFKLPDTAANVQPNWLPYVLVDDPVALAARVTALGGRILVAASPEQRNGSLVVIADPGGAPLALQKFPF